MSIVKIKCKKSGNTFSVDVECECVDSNEREMGTEKMFEANVDTVCPKCSTHISGPIKFWEYPTGFIDHTDDSGLENGSVEDFGIEFDGN